MPRIPALLLCLLATSSLSVAQISHPGGPHSDEAPLSSVISVFVPESPDVDALVAEDDARGRFPMRFGTSLPVGVGVQDGGSWESSATRLVWRLEIDSPGAKSLGVHFDAFDLPETGTVHVYDPGKNVVLGAYTEETELPNGQLAVEPVFGDRVIVEYSQDIADPGQPQLSVGSVVHDYRGILDEILAQQQRVVCLIDVNCPQGAPYQDIKHSVVRTLAGGILCSAGLLTDAQESTTPYLLTANHCGSMVNAVFVFNYERTGCSSGSSSTSQSVSGATFLAATATFDSQLYQLNQIPPKSYSPYYAGWTRTQSPSAPAVAIHHAQGAPKKISIDNDDPGVSDTWFSVSWEEGQLDGGSSGGPLFDGNQRVIGPACCVTSFDCGMQTALYGRFGKFWLDQGLGTWLDPGGTSNGVMNGLYAQEPYARVYNGAGTNPVVLGADPPALASSWDVFVDTNAHPGATSTSLLCYTGKSNGTLIAAGELLLDFGSSQVVQSVQGIGGGGISTHTFMLPNNGALVGAIAYVQAAILGGGAELTNGVKIRLAF